MQTYNLYDKIECRAEPARKKVRLDAYTVGKNAPSVLILPGGAYNMISDSNEGKPIAESLQARGYNAFVLWYRVGAAARYPAPMLDVARAMQFLQSRTDEFGVEENRIALLGSSAGGHLAAYFGAQYKLFARKYEGEDYPLRPAALVLSYPVITMGKLTHALSRRRLLGLFSGKKEQAAASVEQLVSAEYPPTFLWHNKDDASVDYRNSQMLADALEQYGVPHELHLYPTGGHGIGLAKGKDAEGWLDQAFSFLQRSMEEA